MRRLAFPIATLLLAACYPTGEIRASVAEQQAGIEAETFGDVSFRELAPGVWQHTSWLDIPFMGPIPSNGLIVVDGESALLIDTAWTDDQTALILRWVEEVKGFPVRAALVTHAHKDKMGGIAALHAAGVDTWANPLTNELAPAEGFEPARNAVAFGADGWATGAATEVFAPLAIYYPGGGHTRDNITVGVRGRDLAFGGCLIKGAASTSLGNLADADTAHYAAAARNFGAAFSQATTIVMSHSQPEGREAIRHTVALAEELSDAAD